MLVGQHCVEHGKESLLPGHHSYFPRFARQLPVRMCVRVEECSRNSKDHRPEDHPLPHSGQSEFP